MIQDESREARFERKMKRLERRSGKSRIFTGLLLLIVGGALLIQKISSPFPHWVFSWPVIMVALGLFIGIRKKFRGPGWIMFILIGGLFLTADLYPSLNIRQYTWPIVLMIAGVAFMLRPRRHGFGEKWMDWNACQPGEKKNAGSVYNSEHAAAGNDDKIEIVSFLAGTKKIITSKTFCGGEVTSFLGGTELNLSQADINGRVELELTQILGGTKLIVPSHWDIKPELVSVFGGIEDKRQLSGAIDPAKILILKGTSVFGGIEIRNF